jgi:hypothetical protein
MSLPPKNNPDRKQYWLNLLLATITAQVGCVTLVIIIAAILGGLWLDNRFGTKPTYTLALLLVSIPISLGAMFIIVKAASSRIKIKKSGKQTKPEEDGVGKD